MDHLIAFRKTIHRNPELSGQEYRTRDLVQETLLQYGPDEVVKLGETGIAFIYNGMAEGPTVMFRAELDALPIKEDNSIAHRSIFEGVGHLCGHDGHMTILVGLAEHIARERPEHGRVVLLFQPAEETGMGAIDVMNAPGFNGIKPDYIFALHNIPGKASKSVITRKGNFCAASRGLTIYLNGKTAHAAHPELAISPSKAIGLIIMALEDLNKNEELFSEKAFGTIINIQLGDIAFGTTPGYAELRMTLRAFNDNDMKILGNAIEGLIRKIARDEQLDFELQYSEIFPVVVNDDDAVDMIIEASKDLGLHHIRKEEPFRWSEDFGYFSGNYKCGFFGLGAGMQHPALHHPDYDFPDELIKTGLDIYFSIYKKLLK